MKQKLLTDIELDVHELKYLMESFAKEPTQTLSELLKRSITRMQGRLDELLQEVDSVCESFPSSLAEEENKESENLVAELESTVVEETMEEEEEFADSEEDEPAVIETPATVVVEVEEQEEKEEAEESLIVEEKIIVEESVIIKEEAKPTVLGESIKLSAGGLRHSISLNDSFRFSRELFGGDTDLMNRVIEQISVMSSYKTAVAFLSSKVNINEENETLNDFLELLKKYFNQSA